jgi:hypothetical protein
LLLCRVSTTASVPLMPEDIRKHLITSTSDMVQMTRRGSDDEIESNLDM